jgi:hypothetical protein
MLMKKPLFAAVALSIVVATAAVAGNSVLRSPLRDSVLRSLPADVQKDIEKTRAACREYFDEQGIDASQTWFSDTAAEVHRVSSGNEGLGVFTVSGAQAVMVNNLELCGGQCLRSVNCSNRGSYGVAIYIRSGKGWRKALSTEAVGSVFVSTDDDEKFRALILSVFGGNKDCPTHDIPLRRDGKTYVYPAWKQACDAVVKWNGRKFTYKPL